MDIDITLLARFLSKDAKIAMFHRMYRVVCMKIVRIIVTVFYCERRIQKRTSKITAWVLTLYSSCLWNLVLPACRSNCAEIAGNIREVKQVRFGHVIITWPKRTASNVSDSIQYRLTVTLNK